MKVCSKCNIEYDDEFMFCYKCGEKLQQKVEVEEEEEEIEKSNIEQVFCPYCGKKVDSDSDYCVFCGKILHYYVYDKETDNKSKNVSVPANDVKKIDNTNDSYVKPKKKILPKNEEKEESTIVSGAKFFAYAIGMFVLWFLFKVLIKGGVKAWMADGFGLPVIIIFLLAGCCLYFMFYRDDK